MLALKPRIGCALLVFALLIAQQAALAHQYWHATPNAQAEKSLPAKGEKLCNLHHLLGTVLGIAAGAAPAPAFLSLADIGFTAPAVAVRQASPLAPHSRDPPLIP